MKNENLNGPLKRAALFHDLSGFGKCSLTTALPIVSAAGIEGCCVPTAVLSTHTGGFKDYTFRDLTEDLPAYLAHWKKLGIVFDAIYSGYLGSPEQADVLIDFIKWARQKNPDVLVLIDPVMGDNGKLYSTYGDAMVAAMRRLCAQADVLLPNMTEAAFLTDTPYREGPYTDAYLTELAQKLTALGPKALVITGIAVNPDTLGAAVYTQAEGLKCVQAPRVPGNFHGTGDIFASFMLAALLNGQNIYQAAQFAADLTAQAAARTAKRGTPLREGVDFEGVLPEMIKKLGHD